MFTTARRFALALTLSAVFGVAAGGSLAATCLACLLVCVRAKS